ncbi:MAG: MarR family transcriptional regulator, partial [Chitinophagaceae bacterium]|nr:MarR family transcriptional regulator [Chitinophagaceae bacterium]
KGSHPQELCIKDISCRMIERSSNVPRIMDRLVSKKLVKRATSAGDRRETVVSLTSAGINILQLATTEVSRVFEDQLRLNDNEAKQLNLLLEKFRESED